MNRTLNRPFVVRCTLLVLGLVCALLPTATRAHDAVPHGSAVTDLVGFDQRLDAPIPTELAFRNETGQRVTLGQYVGEKPVILALSYFECVTLCPLVRQGLVEALRPLSFVVGDEFDVVLVSIDPTERLEDAARVKQETVASYGRLGSGEGWHFLTGDHDEIDQLADAIGFRFAYDGEQEEYAHASGIVVLTPQGRIARYFFGIEYAPQDVRLGLVEASQNKIGSVMDQLLLLCYHYDPAVGRYSLLIMNVLRMAGAVTVLLLGGLILVMSQRELAHPLATTQSRRALPNRARSG